MSQLECSQNFSQRLPDTCPISQNDLSQFTCATQEIQQPWGRLYPTKPEFQSLELLKNEYTVGRDLTCDLTYKSTPNGKKPSKIHGAISKIHFRIRRTCISTPGFEDFIVHLDDLSSNGTFVNGKIVGKGNSVILENNNEISVCFSSYKVFIYISSSLDPEVKSYPDIVKTDYAISRVLGSGAFGQVRLVFNKRSGDPLAMKVIQKRRFGNDKLRIYDPVKTQREVDVLKSLSHVFIIKFVNVINSENYMFIMTEYMEGGELFDRVKDGPLTEPEAKLYFLQLASAVKYLHDNDIIHRDIKLENILLASREPESIIKLSDFGFSKFLDEESVMMTYCGTPLYIAPEILHNGGKPGSYDKKVDVWSMGVVLFICLSGVLPFKSTENTPLKESILKGNYNFWHSNWKLVSRKAKFLVRKMLTVRSWERISSGRVLSDEWLDDRGIRMKVSRLLKNQVKVPPPANEISDIESDTENKRELKRPRFTD